MVAPISTYGAYGISALSAFSQVAQTQKVDPIAAQEIKEASEVAKTARSLSDRVEPVRPNAKNDGTWAYVQSQNMGLPQVIDIEGMDTSDSKIVIDLKGYNIPESETFNSLEEAQEKTNKNGDKEVIQDIAQELALKYQENADQVFSAFKKDVFEKENSYKSDFDKMKESLFSNQFFGLNSYSESIKAYENYTTSNSSFVA